tara:strand:- start:11660 stop:12442 length:783 start_codon:yes stop_codon:yes gene_type:complete
MNEIKRISFSELKNWKECPYRHKLIYVDKIPYFSGNEFTAFGTAIHTACEHILPNPETNALKVFEEVFLEELRILKNEGFTLNNQLVTAMRQQAIPICEQILPSVKKYFNNFEIFSIEEELMEDMSDIESYGKKFKGFIDLVIKTPDGKYHIIDWKTCSWGWNQQKKSDQMTTNQLTYYKNYFSKKHNIETSKIETYFALLKRTAKKENVEIFKTLSGERKTKNALKVLQNAVINIERGVKIKNRLSCKYCKFHNTEHCT